MVETGRRDIDFAGPATLLVSDRRAAKLAEGAIRSSVGPISPRLPFLEYKIGTLDRDPCHHLRTGGPPAVFAMTVCLTNRVLSDAESHFVAVTSTLNHREEVLILMPLTFRID